MNSGFPLQEMKKLAVSTIECVQNNFSSFSPSAQTLKWMEYVAVNPTTRSFIVATTNFVHFGVGLLTTT